MFEENGWSIKAFGVCYILINCFFNHIYLIDIIIRKMICLCESGYD